MAVYLVTGAAGFIGSNLVEELVRRGERVRALDNLSTGKESNLSPFLESIDFIRGDLCDQRRLREALDGVDFVLHEAAVPSVPRSIRDPMASHEGNATGTLQLLIEARDAGVKKVVFASSSSVYGNSPVLPKVETMPARPLSPYAVNKLTGEEYCRVFTQIFGLPTVSLRYFNVFGPRQDPTSEYAAVVPAFISAMLSGRRPTIYGDGKQTRDFTFVRNVVEANLLACEVNGGIGQALNIACGASISLLDLVQVINRELGTETEPLFEAARPGDVRDSLADFSLAGTELGYRPLVSFGDGIRATIDALRRNMERAD